jgi:hypothetical protein
MNQRGFFLPPFFMSPTGIMTLVIAALLLSNFITYKLWRSEAAEYAQFRTDVETQSALLKAEAERAKAESERISADAAKAWAAVRANRRGTFIVRVPANCDSSGLRSVPAAAPGTDAPAVESGVGATRTVTAEQCQAIANNAIYDAAQVRHLQEWARKQHEVKR